MPTPQNRRWPFTLVVVSQGLDSRGRPITDEDGNPVSAEMPLEIAVYGPNYQPRRSASGEVLKKTVTVLPWGYRTSTGGIKDSGEMFAADYKISCPMLFTPIPEGTILRLTDYTETFYGVVKKQTTYNWGSNIWFDNPGNNFAYSEPSSEGDT